MGRKKEKGQEAGETGRQSLRCNAVSPSVMCGEGGGVHVSQCSAEK